MKNLLYYTTAITGTTILATSTSAYLTNQQTTPLITGLIGSLMLFTGTLKILPQLEKQQKHKTKAKKNPQ